MQILSYSPSVEAYIQVVGNGTSKVIDVTPDITDVRVNRQCDTHSTFSITLQNKNWKYNDVFTPMDKVVVFATKTERMKLISGYINSVSKFTLYQNNFNISGSCTLYRAEKLYFDPGLRDSYNMLTQAASANSQWTGWAQTIEALLWNVGGWSPSSIMIGDIPQEVVDWARQNYEEQHSSIERLKEIVYEFNEVLRSHGPQATTTTAGGTAVSIQGTAAQKAICELYVSWEGRFYYSQEGGRLDPENSGYGDCSSTIWAAYQKAAGIDCGTWTGDMVTKGQLIASGSGELPIEQMQPADLIIVNHYGYSDSFDHVEMYLGDNKYAGHGGPGNGPTIKDNARAYGTYEHDWQVRRYVS